MFTIKLKYILLIPIVLFLSCSNNPELKNNDEKAKNALIGVWRGSGAYGEGEDQGWDESWKIVRHKDGTFEVSYLLVHDGNKEYELTKDSGIWNFENGKYYEIYKENLKSVYKVYSIKRDWFEYNQIERSDEVTIQEVKTEDTFQLQGPPKDYIEVIHSESD